MQLINIMEYSPKAAELTNNLKQKANKKGRPKVQGKVFDEKQNKGEPMTIAEGLRRLQDQSPHNSSEEKRRQLEIEKIIKIDEEI